jgi:hypothetical protein
MVHKVSIVFKGHKFKAFGYAVMIYPKNMDPHLSTVNRHHRFWISTTYIVGYSRKVELNKRAKFLSTTKWIRRGWRYLFFPQRSGGLWSPHNTLFIATAAVACASSPSRAEAKNKWSYSYNSSLVYIMFVGTTLPLPVFRFPNLLFCPFPDPLHTEECANQPNNRTRVLSAENFLCHFSL